MRRLRKMCLLESDRKAVQDQVERELCLNLKGASRFRLTVVFVLNVGILECFLPACWYCCKAWLDESCSWVSFCLGTQTMVEDHGSDETLLTMGMGKMH